MRKKRKKRGGFCRPPRQLYPQEERGIQRVKYRGSDSRVAMFDTAPTARVFISKRTLKDVKQLLFTPANEA
jgi:hypothetical protein